MVFRLSTAYSGACAPAPCLRGPKPVPLQPPPNIPHSVWLAQGSTRKHSSAAVTCAAAAAAAADAELPGGEGGDELQVSEVARENLKKAATACRRYGWISFWTQLVLTTIAAVILLFSMAFTAQVGLGSRWLLFWGR